MPPENVALKGPDDLTPRMANPLQEAAIGVLLLFLGLGIAWTTRPDFGGLQPTVGDLIEAFGDGGRERAIAIDVIVRLAIGAAAGIVATFVLYAVLDRIEKR